MFVVKLFFCFVIFICVSQKGLSQLQCYFCQGGLATPCAKVTQLGYSRPCIGNNAQCYEAIKHFQKSAIKLVERRCWVPKNNSRTTDYCTSFIKPNAKLVSCNTCRTDNCNTHRLGTYGLMDSLKGLNNTDYHFVGEQTLE
ncbi:hypothetical protein HHI36_010313 [Cryptolaemus montrouzieri]|uniref:Sodefrin-like factor n=1 Tax=Cryptolaemus montrouzieri TaxID=559131 RepID=A0ABD2MIU0_9CUCU